MSKALLTIAQEKVSLWEQVKANGGELAPVMEAELSNIDHDLALKVDHYHHIQMELATMEKLLREKASEFEAAARAMKNSHQQLVDRVKIAMNNLGTTELSGNNYKYQLVKSSPKLVIDDLLLPQEYMMAEIVHKVDKEKIEADLQELKEIPGCKYEQVFALKTPVNKKALNGK